MRKYQARVRYVRTTPAEYLVSMDISNFDGITSIEGSCWCEYFATSTAVAITGSLPSRWLVATS